MELNIKHPLALVPTMGALHAGHSSLIKLAKKRFEEVIVSIFINPLQFENAEDLNRYPRSLEEDIALAEAAGATYVWVPTYDEVYPTVPKIILAGAVGSRFEGVHRIGHFDGVLTVVNQLLNLTKPTVAVFGEKDFQQLYLIRKLVHDLKLPIEILAAPIIRESDGLAMSSRNVRLLPADRVAARVISKALRAAMNESTISKQRETLLAILATEPRFTMDYAEIIDEETYEIADLSSGKTRAIVAGWINGLRLLDNLPMSLNSTETRVN